VTAIAIAVMFIDFSSLTGTVSSSARSASGQVETIVGGATRAVVEGTIRPTQPTIPQRGNPTPPAVPQAAAAPSMAGRGPEPAASDAPAPAGLLSVSARIQVDVYQRGRRIGSTEDGPIVLPPGRHAVEFVNTGLNYRGRATVTIQSGLVTAHTVGLPNGQIQVETDSGAQVLIDGRRVGIAPLGPVAAQIGTREIVVRHPAFGERREFVTVRVGTVTTSSMPLQ
jgi:hypothetical protein